MPDTKVSALTALTGANLAKTDEWTVVDKSDTTMDAAGTNKRMTSEEVANGFCAGNYQPKIDAGAEQYVMPGVILNGVGAGQTNELDRIRYEPMIIDHYCQLDTLAFFCSTLHASATVRLACYKADEDWQPTTLMVDTGTIAITTTGLKSVGSLATALTPGRYLNARNASANSGAIYHYRGSLVSGVWMSAATANGHINIIQKNTSTYGAFASTGVAWDNAIASTGVGFDFSIFCQLS